MANDQHTDTVAGEPRDVLLRAILQFEITPKPGGWAKVYAELPPHLVVPFARALYRIEAELLNHDADVFTARAGETRTQSERRHDALEVLVRRVIET